MELSWQLLNSLAEKYGDGFFLVDKSQFVNNCRQFLEVFRCIYANTMLAYSYKTNYLPVLCHAVDQMGGYAEVVSRMEYELAVRLGVRGDRIIFNGPLKTMADIERALLAGSIVNIDCLQEVSWLEQISRRTSAVDLRVGLRCNFDLDAGNRSRFGLSADSGELDSAYQRLSRLSNIRISGLHCHFSTPTRSLTSYDLRVRRLLELAERYFVDTPPDFLDVGGGFFGRMPAEFAKQFDCSIPSYDAYANVIASLFQKRFGHCDGPQLIVEPGAAVVADVMSYAARVIAVKNLGPRKVALVMGSVHDVRPTLSTKRLPIQLYRAETGAAGAGLDGPVDLVGYTCMEHDCLWPQYPDRITIGDFVVFGQVGAYTLVFKPPFIRPSAPVLCGGEAAYEWEIVRRGETFDDIFATFRFPELR